MASEIKMVTPADISLVVSVVTLLLLFGIVLMAMSSWREHRNRGSFPRWAGALPDRLLVSGLGKVEQGVTNLREVVVICHQVENPRNDLLAAVRANLVNGVRYRFFVSKSNYESERNRYYKFFEVIAEMAAMDKPEATVKNLVALEPLPFDWQDKPPFVFYRTSENGNTYTVAYRGFNATKGIDDAYMRVDPYLGHAVLEMLLSATEAPSEDIKPTEFIESDKIIRVEFSKKQARQENK